MADFGFGVAGVGEGGLTSDAGQVLVLVGGDSVGDQQYGGLVEARPERIDRRLAAMEKQVRELSVLLHRLMNPGEE